MLENKPVKDARSRAATHARYSAPCSPQPWSSRASQARLRVRLRPISWILDITRYSSSPMLMSMHAACRRNVGVGCVTRPCGLQDAVNGRAASWGRQCKTSTLQRPGSCRIAAARRPVHVSEGPSHTSINVEGVLFFFDQNRIQAPEEK